MPPTLILALRRQASAILRPSPFVFKLKEERLVWCRQLRTFRMASSTAASHDPASYKFIDIGVNLTDPVFRGLYHGKRKHDDDFEKMLVRSRKAGVKSMIVTGGSLRESRDALKLAQEINMFCTAGCHPTRSSEFEKYASGPDGYLAALDDLISEDKKSTQRVVAVGECGLDYDRLHFASEDTQRTHFRSQLSLAKKHHLPLFLHSRAAHSDFVAILRDEGFGMNGGTSSGGREGVVHSFTGTVDEVQELIGMGFYVSVNGCSLKTEENLNVAKAIPLDRLMLETDAPWCSMTSTHASKRHVDEMPKSLADAYFPPATKAEKHDPERPVKGRNEPCAIGGVAWTISQLHGVNLSDVVEQAYANTLSLFGTVLET